MERKNYVIIVAAGSGSRMASGAAAQPKVLRPIAGRSSLERIVSTFAKLPKLAGVAIVVSDETRDFAQKLLKKLPAEIERLTVAGGAERQESVMRGLDALRRETSIAETDLVMIHDGARPFVSSSLIRSLSEVSADAILPALPATSTVKEVGTTGTVLRTIARSTVYLAQTPQCFHFDLIMRAHEQAKIDQYLGTDDAELVERIGGKVRIVEGDRFNLKLTVAEDFAIAETLAPLLHEECYGTNSTDRPS